MVQGLRCWCGATDLAFFGGGYRACASCGSLVRVATPAGDITHVRDEDGDLYGRRYWFEHQRSLGLPDIEARSVGDLGERCLHWLRIVLQHLSAGGRALELGSAHGGFVAMLRWVGFDASGLELSPWICDYARSTFNVPMLLGPIEDQALEPGLNLVAAMDVLEHLPDPLGTFGCLASLVSDDGVLLIQTPCRPAGSSFDSLDAENHRFLEMMLPEHLFLFSTDAIETLCRRVGLPEVRFETACFPDYDMCLLASRKPLSRRSTAAIRADLLARPEARLVAAMLDLDHRHVAPDAAGQQAAVKDQAAMSVQVIQQLTAELAAVRRDQSAKQALIHEHTLEIARLRTDQSEKDALIRRISKELATVREDQSAKQALIHEHTLEIARLRTDQSEKDALIRRISKELATVREDQSAKEALIREHGLEIAGLRTDQSEKDALIRRISKELAAVRTDQSAKEALIRRISKELAAVREDQARKELLIRRAAREIEAFRRP